METRADPRSCGANLAHLLPYDYPDLTLSGRAVLRTARAAFPLSPAVTDLITLTGGWGEEPGMVGGTAFKARQPWCASLGRVSSVMTTSTPAQKREKIRLMRY